MRCQVMFRHLLCTAIAAPALAWKQPRFGYVPGNNFGIPQNESYDYVVIGGGSFLRNVAVYENSVDISQAPLA